MEQDRPGCSVLFGATGGLGGAIARAMAREALPQVLTFRSRKEIATQLAEELVAGGARADTRQCDVTELATVQGVLQEAHAKYGHVQSVICATGEQFHFGRVPEQDPAVFRSVIETDVIGFFNIAHAALPLMRPKGGSIVATGTAAQDFMMYGDCLSSVPKAAVSMLVRHIAAEEGRHRIRANVVGAGVYEAGMTLQMMGRGTGDNTFEGICKRVPLRRAGQASEFAEVVAFLASERASYVTGQVIHADGGLSA